MSSLETTDVTIAIRLLRADQDEFLMMLRADGSGELVDVSYDERISLEHPLTPDDICFLATLPTTKHRNWRGEGTSAIDEDALDNIGNEQSARIIATVVELFDELNQELDNPIGDCPEDYEESYAHGDAAQFSKTMAAISLLAHRHGYDDSIDVYSGHDDESPRTEHCDQRISNIVDAAVDYFWPMGATYEYVDENDGRVTAYTACGNYNGFTAEDALTHFPSARERIEVKAWLRSAFTEYGLPIALIEHTFPPYGGTQEVS